MAEAAANPTAAHTSASLSPKDREKQLMAKFKPMETGEDIPPAPRRMWVVWLVILCVLGAAEIGARLVVSLDIVEAPSRYFNTHMDSKLDWFNQHFAPAEMPGNRYLIMGSSMPNTNLDPKTLSAELEEQTGEKWVGFNGALYAGRMEDMIFFMEYYNERWPYEVLVMTIEPWGLKPGRIPMLQERVSKPFFEQWLMRHSMLFRMRNQWIPYDTSRDTRARGLMALDAGGTIYGWNRTIMELKVAPENPEWTAERQGREDFRDPQTGEYLELTRDLVLEAQAWAAERGITVIWLLQPMSPVMEQFMPPHLKYPAWRRYAQEVASMPGNYLIDLKDMEGTVLADDDYFDVTHLSPRGALIFSEEVGERMGELLERMDEP